MLDFRTLSGRGNFYFLRHGESEGNSARVIQGRGDFPLAEKGLEQARQATSWFADRRIDTILCSPLKRAAETAEVFRRELGLEEIRYHEGLNEADTGIFTGHTVPEIQERYPEAWCSFQLSSWEGVPEAERIAGLLARAESVWAELAGLFGRGSRNILCVTHSGILQWLIKATFGQRDWMPLVPMGNCSVCHFSLDNDLEAGDPRYYFEWTRLNYQPFAGEETQGNLFLDRSGGNEKGKA